ncbi:MAG: cation transporter [marine bacterium B5-7]|nr:MAG: cation transporter [marine bacterium B5-7]
MKVIKIVYTLLLAGLWWVLSGHTEWYLLALGIVSVGMVLMLAGRMALIDSEVLPITILPRIPLYWGWLFIEVIKSNIAVARQILAPRPIIDPALFTTPCSQSGDVFRVCFANSITLTPGTVAVAINKDNILVHALTADARRDLNDGAMNRRVLKLESGT